LKVRIYCALLLISLGRLSLAQESTVRGVVEVLAAKGDSASPEVVVWLTNLGEKEAAPPGPMVRLLQKDKRFMPHLLVITVGTPVEFPNQDPLFHDVFSIYHGKPFDLGLYESGAVRKVKFTETGISYIFCNIHPAMSAVVVAVATPHYAKIASHGSFQILQVPPGRYKLEVWSEQVSQAELASVSREISIHPGENSLPAIVLHSTGRPNPHFNKYGEAYSRDKTPSY
jgi:plastocyanin